MKSDILGFFRKICEMNLDILGFFLKKYVK